MTEPKRGRPPRADRAATERLEVRITPDERKAWERAAVAAGVTLSEWIRQRCQTTGES